MAERFTPATAATSTPSATPATSRNSTSHAALVGGLSALGVIVIVGALGALLIFFMRKRRRLIRVKAEEDKGACRKLKWSFEQILIVLVALAPEPYSYNSTDRPDSSPHVSQASGGPLLAADSSGRLEKSSITPTAAATASATTTTTTSATPLVQQSSSPQLPTSTSDPVDDLSVWSDAIVPPPAYS